MTQYNKSDYLKLKLYEILKKYEPKYYEIKHLTKYEQKLYKLKIGSFNNSAIGELEYIVDKLS